MNKNEKFLFLLLTSIINLLSSNEKELTEHFQQYEEEYGTTQLEPIIEKVFETQNKDAVYKLLETSAIMNFNHMMNEIINAVVKDLDVEFNDEQKEFALAYLNQLINLLIEKDKQAKTETKKEKKENE